MRLNYIQLCNFRQFYGESPKLHLARGRQNVTVVHGLNGAGKTAILNAFTWALYESFSPGFERVDSLINRRALRETKVGDRAEAWVEIELEHADQTYLVRRTLLAHKDSDDIDKCRELSSATLQICTVDGESYVSDNFDDKIGWVLPKHLQAYFFFDGEWIERLVRPDKELKRKTGRAAKELLGIEVVERAEKHLNQARKRLESDLHKLGDSDTQALIEEKSRLEIGTDEIKSGIDEMQKEIDSFEEIKTEIEDRLSELKDAKDLQQRRSQLKSERTRIADDIKRADQDVQHAVTLTAYYPLLAEARARFVSIISDLRSKELLPSSMRKHLLDKLLEDGTCICKRSLPDGSNERQAIEEWRNRVGLVEAEERAIRLDSEVSKGVPQKAEQFWAQLDKSQDARRRLRAQLSRIEDEIDRIGDKLKSSSQTEVSTLESRLEDINRRSSRCNQELGRLRYRLQETQREIGEVSRKIEKMQARERQQAIAQRRVTVANSAVRTIGRIQASIEHSFRLSLESKIRERFSSISYKSYIPCVDDDYSVSLKEKLGESPLPVAKSTGEAQILSLSFIGSIIEATKEFKKKTDSDVFGAESVEYPLVMDAPFGNLDQNYSTDIARMISTLADQVVLLVHKKQWRGEVENALAESIGRSYVLCYHPPRSKDLNQFDRQISLSGRAYDLIAGSADEFEYTEIFEVSGGEH